MSDKCTGMQEVVLRALVFIIQPSLFMRLLKFISFGLLTILLLTLITATILEKMYGAPFARTYCYSSLPFVILWAIFALFSTLYIIRRKVQRHLATFLLHISFLVILAGAFITWLCSEQGTIHLRQGEPADCFIDNAGKNQPLPFCISLDEFQILYYTGTRAPMDFISKITITKTETGTNNTIQGEVSMNHIFSYDNYRFYQSGYDNDGQGTRLSISHDPYGIGITYTGYGLLLLSILLFFGRKDSHFRQLLKSPLLKQGTMLCCFMLCALFSLPSHAADAPKVLPQEIAKQFGDLYVLYNNRICPLQTLARDFTIKLYGSSSYRGYSAEQVLSGWMYYYNDWKKEPMIQIKSRAVRQTLNTSNKYVALKDFINNVNEYKLGNTLDQIRSGQPVSDRRGFEEADEKYNLITMLYSGKLLKIFPHSSTDSPSAVEWYSPNDKLPEEISNDKKIFIRKSLDYIHEMAIGKNYKDISLLLEKLRTYQQKDASGAIPSASKFTAEKIYNQLDFSKIIAIVCIIAGLAAFVYYCQNIISKQKKEFKWFILFLNILAAGCFIYLSLAIGLRGYVSNHLPLANGFETMQFMAWCSLLLLFVFEKKFPISLSFGFLLCGLTLMVSMMGESNPQITPLMPVLISPLLCLHVVVIMIAYSLLAFVMLNGILSITLHLSHRDCSLQIERLHIISQLILYPAVFLLAAGIFIGAVWANISWGRYWGWDPKEVWALITMLVYALALHPSSLPLFRKPLFFHSYMIIAFLTVLMTYFGVNFLLGGMHSYANG